MLRAENDSGRRMNLDSWFGFCPSPGGGKIWSAATRRAVPKRGLVRALQIEALLNAISV